MSRWDDSKYGDFDDFDGFTFSDLGDGDEFADDFLAQYDPDGTGRTALPRRHPLIGLVGRARSGKNTIARYLVDHHGWTTLAFADPIRQVLSGMDPYLSSGVRLSDVLELHGGWSGAKHSEYGGEIRVLLQRLGTEGVRELDPRFWAKQMEARIENVPGPAIITDIRFENEATLVRNLGGKLVMVTRPNYPRLVHATEQVERISCDFEIENSGAIEDLPGPIREILAEVTRS